MTRDDRELIWLRRARDLSHRLAEARELAPLLPLILDSAIELAGAERGFLVRVQPGAGLRVEVARGFDGQTLQSTAGAVPRRVVEEVLKKDAGVVTTREEDRGLLDATTVRERRVLAILCVPMRLRGRTVGVIYLDHRFRPDAFHPGDVEPLRVFADQAALAIEGAELRIERERALAQLEAAREQLRAHEQVERRRRSLQALHRAHRDAGTPEALGALVGACEAAQGLFAAIERAGRSRDPVLIVGETGSGKTAAAHELHRLTHGDASDAPLHVAHAARTGERELEAHLGAGGTLLLEEVGDAPPALQAALVALLQEDRRAPRPTRVVATSRVDLGALVRAGTLREDLYYRLDVLRVDVPPLRARRDDVPLLLDHLSTRAGRRLELTPAALQALVDHAWPGNLHELQNVVRRLVTLDKKVTTSDLPESVRGPAPTPEDERTIAGMERRMVVEALEACGGNKAMAARRLGIQRSTLYRLLDRYGLR